MFTYSSLYASNPTSGSAFITFCTITAPSRPAFTAICLNGSSNAFLIILAPIASSPSNSFINFSTAGITLTSAVPPPATIPSSTAALVAFKASSILNFFSFISTSVAAPTLTTATPPDNLASLSINFSLSKSEVVSSAKCFIWFILFSMLAFSPAPPTIVVLSFVTFIEEALPNMLKSASFNS